MNSSVPELAREQSTGGWQSHRADSGAARRFTHVVAFGPVISRWRLCTSADESAATAIPRDHGTGRYEAASRSTARGASSVTAATPTHRVATAADRLMSAVGRIDDGAKRRVATLLPALVSRLALRTRDATKSAATAIHRITAAADSRCRSAAAAVSLRQRGRAWSPRRDERGDDVCSTERAVACGLASPLGINVVGVSDRSGRFGPAQGVSTCGFTSAA
jgi:hypothetical protein